MTAPETCPNCGGDDVWMEERPSQIEYGCNLCNHRWNREKET